MAKRKPAAADRRAKLAAVRAQQARQERRQRLRTIGLISVAVALVAAALTAVALTDHHSRAAATPTAAGAARTTPPPWPAPPASEAPELVKAAGLPLLAMEANDVHFHAHLDVIVDGKPVQVPTQVGMGTTSLSPLHVHDTTGIIHIEVPKAATFTLGQLFTEWNVRLTSTCIGGLCADSTHQLAVYLNGRPYTADPRQLVLAAHQEIAIEYGQRGHLPSPPSRYTFPAGV